MADVVLRTHNLSKKFKDRWAVRGVNLEVFAGDVFGFLGQNGAGKSTTIRMLLSLIKPTSGSVELFGYSLERERERALAWVAGIVEKPDFYLYLTAERNLEIVGALNGGVSRKRIHEVLELVGLASRARDKVRTFSHGMKQRLGIAQALLTDPQLVILDEPTSGLDPQGMREVRDLIVTLSRDQKKTILLSSHLLHEIEMVATRMGIINKGEMVVQGEVSKLLDEGETYVLLSGEPRSKIASVLKSRVFRRRFVERNGTFQISMPFADVPRLNKELVRKGVSVKSLIPRRSLEDYFLSITGESSEV
ncbi:MAG TPA: ABC transporter ATP-binding protein [Bacteroidota bacterium]|nr:ABC transporter ATP-binding protein [Bacteroidota bacterium]